ncbi:recombination protein O N-terminal domain-containing protein [Candidatus Saccharibacteria bacterium]|nr:recombination protein O N-terminal domain-containing protein [Candidatus Saccharibacteria bacterium]
MSQNSRGDIKTLAYVLRRTNYGEADRILNLITPGGKKSVIVKGCDARSLNWRVEWKCFLWWS